MFSLLIYQQPPHKFCDTECSARIQSDELILDRKKEERDEGKETGKGGKKEGSWYAGGKLVD